MITLYFALNQKPEYFDSSVSCSWQVKQEIDNFTEYLYRNKVYIKKYQVWLA